MRKVVIAALVLLPLALCGAQIDSAGFAVTPSVMMPSPCSNTDQALTNDDAGTICLNVRRGQTQCLTSDYTNATDNFTDVGLSFAAAAGAKYAWTCYLNTKGTSTGRGVRFQITGPTSPTALSVTWRAIKTVDTETIEQQSAFSTPTTNTNTDNITSFYIWQMTLLLTNGANAGTVALQGTRSSSSLGDAGIVTMTVGTGSCCELVPVI